MVENYTLFLALLSSARGAASAPPVGSPQIALAMFKFFN